MNIIKEFSKEIVLKALMPSKPSFDIPFINRAGYRTAFWLFDTMPEHLGVQKIGEIDFINEMEYLAMMHEAYILGEDISFQHIFGGNSLKYDPLKYQEAYKKDSWIPYCIGDRVIDTDWNVYKITAFYTKNSWSRDKIYFDVK